MSNINNTTFSVIITAFNEDKTVGKAIENIVKPNIELWARMQLIIIAPDVETIRAAQIELEKYNGYKNFLVIKDKGNGKPAALNLAYTKTIGEIIFFTDGDMYINENSIKLILPYFDKKEIGGVSGHPISQDSRKIQFGYYSHLFCEAAHIKRLKDKQTPMSGYLYAIRNIKDLFPIPEEVRAEDAYISKKLLKMGYVLNYEPNALAYVKFPKNSIDWYKQKRRSLGGNIQIKNNRSIIEDISMIIYPLKYGTTIQEKKWSLILYPIRLFLWIKIYLSHITRSYSKGAWERIESSK
jgi:cellulose synthase/poly-beta-1,6-N-acetylglucosamine synthase-like glycosyltransferase